VDHAKGAIVSLTEGSQLKDEIEVNYPTLKLRLKCGLYPNP